MLNKITLSILLTLAVGCRTTKDSTVETTTRSEKIIRNDSIAQKDTSFLIPGDTSAMEFVFINDTLCTDSDTVVASVLVPIPLNDGTISEIHTIGKTKYIKKTGNATVETTVSKEGISVACNCDDTVLTVKKWYEAHWYSESAMRDSISSSNRVVTKEVMYIPLIVKILAAIGAITVTLKAFSAYKYLKVI